MTRYQKDISFTETTVQDACLRSIFKKSYIEGLVTVLSFDCATRAESIGLVQEDDVFKE